MSSRQKTFIISIIIVVVLSLIGVGIYCSWDAIVGSINNKKYYTSKDLQNSYDQGYSDGIKNEDDLSKQIDYWKGLADANYQMFVDTKYEKEELEKNNLILSEKLLNLQNEKDVLQSKYDGVYSDYLANEKAIQENTNTISSLNARIRQLEASGTDKSNEIISLKNQIKNLQNSNDQLTLVNQNNLNTITLLNNQIVSLNEQISSLTEQVRSNAGSVNALNAKIAQLEKSIAYYEEYIAQLENGEKVVATFEYNGSVYNVQIVSKNSPISVVEPASTQYLIFNGWTVDGKIIDINSYVISKNTKFIASLTYKYDVSFIVDDVNYNSQIITKNSYATLPTDPSKDGYDFDGWTLNGVDVIDPSSIAISDNTTFIAKFSKKHTVIFMYEDTVIDTQVVSNGQCASVPNVSNSDYKVFNGWKLNGVITNVLTYSIYSDLIFYADITYKYLVTFKVENEIYNSQFVVSGSFVVLPKAPTKDGYNFVGWTTDGETIVNLETLAIDENKTFIAKFNFDLPKLVYFGTNGVSFNGLNIWNDGENVYFSSFDGQFMLDKLSNTWIKNPYFNDNFSKVWTYSDNIYSTCGVFDKDTKSWVSSPMAKGNVWTDGDNLYYSYGSTHMVYDNSTSTWITKTWKGLTKFDSSYVWTDGNNIYCSNSSTQYILDKSTSTWSKKTWTGLTSFSGSDIWVYENNIYCSSGSTQYVLDKNTSTWSKKTWTGLTSFYGSMVWTDIDNVLHYDMGLNHFIYDSENSTWIPYSWYGLTQLSGKNIKTFGDFIIYIENAAYSANAVCGTFIYNKVEKQWYEFSLPSISVTINSIWSDGTNIFCYDNNSDYILNKESLTWTKISLGSYNLHSSSAIWTDGIDVYYSYNSANYVFDKETLTWSHKTWTGLVSFQGSYIWSDGVNVYYSKGTTHYILDKTTSTWSIKTWTGLSSFNGNCIWSDNENTYYSFDNTTYILNKETSTWTICETYTGLIDSGLYIWNDGTYIYYSYIYDNMIIGVL